MNSVNWGLTLRSYFVDSDYTGVIWPIGVILLFYLLSRVVLLGMHANASTDRRLPEMIYLLLKQAHVFSYVIIGTVAIAFFCYLFHTEFYNTHNLEIWHLATIATLAVCLMISRRQWSQGLQRREIRSLYGQPLSRREEENLLRRGLRKFKSFRWWLLVPLLGFTILLIRWQDDRNIISITLDTSTSMGEGSLFESSSALKAGKQAISQALYSVNTPTDIIITVFTDGTPRGEMSQLLAIQDYDHLIGRNRYFSESQKNEAINYIQSLEPNISFSPIVETVWKNVLFLRKNVVEYGPYDNVIGIIISDGGETELNDEISSFLCANDVFNELFPNPERLHIINLQEGYNNAFMNQSMLCGYRMEDGYEPDLYLGAMLNIVASYQADYSFVILLALLTMILTFVLILINPSVPSL